MTPPPGLTPLAGHLYEQIVAHSDGRPILSIEEAASALAALGAWGSSPTALTRLIRLGQLPPAAIDDTLGKRKRISAVGLAQVLAGDLKVERPAEAPKPATVAVPTRVLRPRSLPPPRQALPRLTAAEAKARGMRYVIREPGDLRPAEAGTVVLVLRRRPARRLVLSEADEARAAALAADLVVEWSRAATALEDLVALWAGIGGEPPAVRRRIRARPGGL